MPKAKTGLQDRNEPFQFEGNGRQGNGGKEAIEASAPFTVIVSIEGTADILFHRWSNEAVEAKSKAAKNSKAKKTDDVESYVYRLEDGNPESELAIPGEYMRRAICEAGRYRQDPRSPRKSMLDMLKAAIVVDNLATLGTTQWDYIHAGRVVIQRNAITRHRPAMRKGWRATFNVQVLLPEYVHDDLLNSLIVDAGRLIGLADFRPSYGRFKVIGWEVVPLE